MQRTSMVSIFSFSAALCSGAIAALSIQEFPMPVGKRNMATIEKIDRVNHVKQSEELGPKQKVTRSYKIASAFRRSRAIWGVYDKVQDNLEEDIKPGEKIKTIKTSLGELILKDGQVVLVSPLSYDGITQVEVASLPYLKDGKNSYNIDLASASLEQKAAVVRLYAPLIQGIKGSDGATLEQMKCLKSKNNFSCEISMKIQ